MFRGFELPGFMVSLLLGLMFSPLHVFVLRTVLLNHGLLGMLLFKTEVKSGVCVCSGSPVCGTIYASQVICQT